MQVPSNEASTPTRSDTNECIRHSQWTYGSPIRDLFGILMKETDKDAFYNTLEVFRGTLKQYGQEKLLQYFEKCYFTEDRIKQCVGHMVQGPDVRM